jgi:hypothetical protein
MLIKWYEKSWNIMSKLNFELFKYIMSCLKTSEVAQAN